MEIIHRGNRGFFKFLVILTTIVAVKSQDVNECTSTPCRNGAICINTNGGFVCACNPPWTGLLCETAATTTETDIPPTGFTLEPDMTTEVLPTDLLRQVEDALGDAVAWVLKLLAGFTLEPDMTTGVLPTVGVITQTIQDCPSSFTVAAEGGNIFTSVTYNIPRCMSSMGPTPGENATSSECRPPSGNKLGVGVTSVSCFCTSGVDPNNTDLPDSCTFNINVLESIPVGLSITCPDPIQNVITGNGRNVSWAQPTCTINGQSDPSLIVTCEPPTGSFFGGVSSTNVMCTCEDTRNGTGANCSFPVTISSGDSLDSPPIIEGCPSDQVVDAEPDQPCVVISYIKPTCNASEIITEASCSAPTRQVVIPGNYTVTCSCEDSGFSVEMCSFTIRVNLLPPFYAAVCPVNVFRRITGTSAKVFWDEPQVFEAFSVTRTHTPGDTFLCGSSTVSYTYQNRDGTTTTTCSFLVTVTRVDDVRPAINCNDQVVISTKPTGSTNRSVDFTEPFATDNAGVAYLLPGPRRSGDLFPLGETTLTYTFNDTCGNTAGCNFSVTVIPGIESCPNSTTVMTCNDEESGSWETPIISTNDTRFTVESSHSPGDVFQLGTTIVFYSVEEEQSRKHEVCNFTITVKKANSCPTAPYVYIIVVVVVIICILFALFLLVILKIRHGKRAQPSTDNQPAGNQGIRMRPANHAN